MEHAYLGSSEVAVLAPGEQLPAARPSVAERDLIAAKWIAERGVSSKHTAARYRRDITVFFEWADAAGYDVFSMLPWHIGEYAGWLQQAEHVGRYRGSTRLSPATRAGRLNAVSAFYRFVQENVRTTFIPNPAEFVKRPKVSRESKTRGLDTTELTALREVAQKRGLREYALVQLLAGTGLRISEAVEADTGDLQREGDVWYLYVVRKGGEDQEPVQVPAPAVRALRRYIGPRRGPLFLDNKGQRLSRQAAGNRLRSMATAAEISGRKISPHSLRHTATTLLLDQGVNMRDVQVFMGHRSTETTARYDRANRRKNNPAAAAMAAIIADDLPGGDF